MTRRSPAEMSAHTSGAKGFVEHDLGAGSLLVRPHHPNEHGSSAFGPGFRTLLDVALLAEGGHAVISLPARRLRFLPTSTGWLCTAGPLHRLEVDVDGWRLRTSGRTVLEFDRSGRLRSWRSPATQLDTVTDSSDRIVRLDDRRAQRRLHLDWAGDTVAQLADDRGATATYTYGVADDEVARLVRVCRPDGVVTYRWHGDVARRAHHRWAS